MGRTYKFKKNEILSDISTMPVTYQGNIIGRAIGTHDGVDIVIDDIYVPVFDSMIRPSIKSFSLEVRVNG
jgi:hypothetical protein